MPQSIFLSAGVNNNYPVPSGSDSSTYNYYLETKASKLNIVLGATLSGPGAGAYSVGIQVNNDTVRQLLAAGVYDSTVYKLMPASLYTLPTQLDVAQGAKSGTFDLSLDLGALKSAVYAGKFLLLAVKIVNPTRYTLDTALSTTVVIVDVNTLVIGPSVDITAQYILNPGNPFIASAMNGSRWGSLKNWNVNTAAASHGGVGGYGTDGDGQTMDLESGWGSPAIYNGKVWQTLNLPAGTYAFDPSGGTWKWQGTLNPTYAVVAPAADTLPDYTNVVNDASIQYQVIAQPQPKINFQLTAPGKVTIGIVINYVKDQQGFKSTKVSLYNYPKHL
jgi:hypothetical protein